MKEFIATLSLRNEEPVDLAEVKLKFNLWENRPNVWSIGVDLLGEKPCPLWYLLDTQFDSTFDEVNPIPYLVTWINNRWSGKNGSYKLIGLIIKEQI